MSLRSIRATRLRPQVSHAPVTTRHALAAYPQMYYRIVQCWALPFRGNCREPIKARREVAALMAEKLVGKASEFQDGDRRIVFVGDTEIGVFKDRGEFHAYSNYCLHQGGPACEGLIIAKVEERIAPDKTSKGMYFSDTETHFVCPWHGYEYDIKTGECVSDRRLKLRRYKVVQKGDE